MNRRHLLIALLLFLISTLAMAYTPNLGAGKLATTVYQYDAETTATASKQGNVLAGGLNWHCMGSRCSISGPWPTPAVASCKALAGMVGPVRSYGHNQGSQLNAAQLAQCNAGLAVAATQSVPLSTPAKAGGPKVTTAQPSNTTKGLLPAVTEKDFVPQALPTPGVNTGKAQAKPTYQLNSKPGEVAFGDGRNGARPPVTTGTGKPSGVVKIPVPLSAPATTVGGFAGATLAPAQPAVNNPAMRQITHINPAIARQLKFRSDLYSHLERSRKQAEETARRQLELRKARGTYGVDCDDTRRDVNPNAAEVCDGVDNDCDGSVDENVTLPRFLDADGDGHGDPAHRLNVCPSDIARNADAALAGNVPWLVEIGNDCNDNDADHWHSCE